MNVGLVVLSIGIHFIVLNGFITEGVTGIATILAKINVLSVGAVMIFKVNASSGGTEIVAFILKKHFKMFIRPILLHSQLSLQAVRSLDVD